MAAVALGVFWVTAGTPGGLPTNFMFEGGFLLCAGLAALVVADARLVEPGWFSRVVAWHPLHFIGTISYGIYLWHWPVIVYLNGTRTGLSTWPLDALRIAVTLAVSTASYYLVERPIRRAHLRGWVRWWGAPVAGVVSAVVIVVATIPAVADPSRVVGTTHLTTTAGPTVPGSGGYQGQQPIRLTTAPSPTDPLRVMVLGDSVMHDASYGITAALQATGEATVATRTIDGFGLTVATELAHVDPQPHPPDPGPAHRRLVELGPVRAYDAQRVAPAGPVHEAAPPGRGHDAHPGQRRRRRHLHGVPAVGAHPGRPTPPTRRPTTRSATTASWPGTPSPPRCPRTFPGRVMYFPLADSILLAGRYSTWLPPEGNPHAPSPSWIRVRKVDKVHLCPEGSARYGDALLTDVTSVFALTPATGDWSQGAWTSDPNFNDPPGACPDDHPPAR